MSKIKFFKIDQKHLFSIKNKFATSKLVKSDLPRSNLSLTIEAFLKLRKGIFGGLNWFFCGQNDLLHWFYNNNNFIKNIIALHMGECIGYL